MNMAAVRVTDLYEDIMLLSADDREQLLSNLQRDSQKTLMSKPLSREESVVFDALMSVCDVKIAQNRFLESYGRAKYAEKVQTVYEYVASTRKFLRLPQVQALVALCLRCLANDLKSREIPTTPKIVLDNLNFLAHAVDKAFPGYASAGLLHRLVDAA
jgi:hypothetical protein